MDIVSELRGGVVTNGLLLVAADQIEQLRAALEPFAKIADEYAASDAVSERHHKDEGRAWKPTSDGHRTTIFLGTLRRARAALAASYTSPVKDAP